MTRSRLTCLVAILLCAAFLSAIVFPIGSEPGASAAPASATRKQGDSLADLCVSSIQRLRARMRHQLLSTAAMSSW